MSSSSRGKDETAVTADSSSEPATPSLPPETSSSIQTRRMILLAFWAVVVALGLPQWIWTTSIHRSNLPIEMMNDWANGKACQLQYPLNIRLESSDLGPEHAIGLATDISNLLNADQGLSGLQFRVTAEQLSENDETALTVNLLSDKKASSTSASLRSWASVLDVQHNPARSVDTTTLAPFIATEIRKVFRNDKDVIAYLLSSSPFSVDRINSLTKEEWFSLDAKATRAFKYASNYHLTFSLFTSSGSPSSWDIEKALKDSINPLLHRLSSISKFTIESQVQLYASFSPSIAGPQYDASSKEWKLQRSDLSGFINAAEWPLSPSIGSGPTINFVLFVPSPDQSPLVLAETGGNSWLIPQWGGVQILNPSGKHTGNLTAKDLQPTMLTFADQLTSLLGLPESPPSLALRISSLTRQRATALMISASSTLGALSRLTLKLTSIAIPDTVAKSVDETIYRLTETCSSIKEGRYEKALEHARIAEAEAEHAFFEPSMVGQVYFPEEHKVAVYVPLLGPMAVPLVMAAVKEIKKFRERKAKTE